MRRPDPTRFGLIALATDLTVESDARELMPLDVALHVTRIAFENPTTPDNLRAMGPHLAQAARLLVPGVPLDGIGFACTSAAALLGERVEQALAEVGRGDVPLHTPTRSARAAFHALGVERVALLTPYLPETTLPVRQFFERHQIAVVAEHSMNYADDREMARLDNGILIDAARAADDQDAQALFLSCTALPALGLLAQLEEMLGKPVISANQALFWAMAQAVGRPLDGPGALFRMGTRQH